MPNKKRALRSLAELGEWYRAQAADGPEAETHPAAAAASVAVRTLARAAAARQRAERRAARNEAAAGAATHGRAVEMLAATKEIAATSEPKEAREMLGLAANEYPGSPEDASLGGIIAQDQLDRKSEAAAEALWRARYDRPEDPGSAVEQLAGLDLGGLPELLRGEVFCAWLQACRRLCQARRYLEPLFRATGAERGLVMARPAPGRPYVVVSALGMGPAVRPGDPVRHRALSRAWPLTPGRPGGGRPDRPGQRAAGRQDA